MVSIDKKTVQQYSLNKELVNLRQAAEQGFDLNSLTKKHFVNYTFDEYLAVKEIQNSIKSARFFNTQDEQLFSLVLEENKSLISKDETKTHVINNKFNTVFINHLRLPKKDYIYFIRDVVSRGTAAMVTYLFEFYNQDADFWFMECVRSDNDDAVKALLQKYDVDFSKSLTFYMIYEYRKTHLFSGLFNDKKVNVAKHLAFYMLSKSKVDSSCREKNTVWYKEVKDLIPELLDYKEVINGNEAMVFECKKGANDVSKELKTEKYMTVLAYYIKLSSRFEDKALFDVIKMLIDTSDISLKFTLGYKSFYPGGETDEWVSNSEYLNIIENDEIKSYFLSKLTHS